MPTLDLKYPLVFGKKTITQLRFRDYTTAGDYLSFDRHGGVAQRIAMIASLTGTDESLIEQLRGPDYVAAERIADALIASDSVNNNDDDDDDDDDPNSEEANEKKSSE